MLHLLGLNNFYWPCRMELFPLASNRFIQHMTDTTTTTTTATTSTMSFMNQNNDDDNNNNNNNNSMDNYISNNIMNSLKQLQSHFKQMSLPNLLFSPLSLSHRNRVRNTSSTYRYNISCIIDGSHNGESIEKFLTSVRSLDNTYKQAIIIVLFGAGEEKNVSEMLEILKYESGDPTGRVSQHIDTAIKNTSKINGENNSDSSNDSNTNTNTNTSSDNYIYTSSINSKKVNRNISRDDMTYSSDNTHTSNNHQHNDNNHNNIDDDNENTNNKTNTIDWIQFVQCSHYKSMSEAQLQSMYLHIHTPTLAPQFTNNNNNNTAITSHRNTAAATLTTNTATTLISTLSTINTNDSILTNTDINNTNTNNGTNNTSEETNTGLLIPESKLLSSLTYPKESGTNRVLYKYSNEFQIYTNKQKNGTVKQRLEFFINESRLVVIVG